MWNLKLIACSNYYEIYNLCKSVVANLNAVTNVGTVPTN